MGVSWSFPDRFHIERGPDQVVIRSQWGQLVPSILIGTLFLAGLAGIAKANGMLSAPYGDPGWIVLTLIGSVCLFIMVPRRLTVSFDCRTRKAVRLYQFAFGLITRRHEISFDDIASIAAQSYYDDGETVCAPTIRPKNGKAISLAMRSGSLDEALGAAQALSSATGIALEQG